MNAVTVTSCTGSRIYAQTYEWQSGMRSCKIPGLPAQLGNKLNIITAVSIVSCLTITDMFEYFGNDRFVCETISEIMN